MVLTALPQSTFAYSECLNWATHSALLFLTRLAQLSTLLNNLVSITAGLANLALDHKFCFIDSQPLLANSAKRQECCVVL